MPKLPPPDSHHLMAAIGWLELGNPEEAGCEIARISEAWLDHPDVLEIRWSICAAGNSWETGLEIANKMVELAPERSSSWVNRAYALRRVKHGGLKAAWEVLRPAYNQFPTVSIIPYNLACYAAQFGRLDEAWEWLHKAMEASKDIDSIKELALQDKDLETLWDRIRDL